MYQRIIKHNGQRSQHTDLHLLNLKKQDTLQGKEILANLVAKMLNASF